MSGRQQCGRCVTQFGSGNGRGWRGGNGSRNRAGLWGRGDKESETEVVYLGDIEGFIVS